MRKFFFPALIALMLCLPLSVKAKVDHLLPKVHSLTETKGTPFALHRAVTITDANNTVALKEVFTDYGCTIEDGASATVTVEMVESIEGAYDYTLEGYDNEGYQLTVTENAIAIKAVKPIGVIRAAQTLAQLAEGYDEGNEAIETVEITDWAAFKLRGYMHDVGRSFISVDELKKHIDLLSRFKVNTFHWHFTENQAWRFEVIDNDLAAEPDYTKLTSTESMTRFEGKYYTQAQCREVAQYAKERGVTIIPEIDMPGHSDAFERAMGYSMQTDEGVAVLKEVLTQLADVFPDAPYIHIGADEEAITYTKDGKGFLEIMAGHIRETLGRKMVVWNPISGVTINSTMTDMTQMWSSRGTDITGVPDIDCRYNYTNHFDVFADVVGIYKSNIYYADKGSEEIAGTISAYWNDRKTPTEEDIVKQNNMYANVLASAERAWIGGKVNGAEGYIEKLGTTLPNSGEVYEEFKDWETRFLFHKAHSLKDEPIPYVKQTNVRWRITDPFPNGGNSGATFAPDQYATSTDDEELIPETFIHEGKTYYTGMATGAGIYLRHTWGNNTIPTYYGTTNHSNMTAYAWTYVYSPKAQTVGAQIEFQNYGRSEKDSAPDAGKWDRKGSDIWLNGSRINPPTWDNTGKGINNEVDLLNENFTARSPIEVQLNEGWNKVFIKLPYVGAGGVRLNKWMFTCVFTDLEGKNAVEGLIYSPNQCKDEATELVAAKVSEIKRDRGALIGTAVGLWPESAAATLDSEIAAIEATYDEAKTAEERAAQVTALEEVWTAFTASLTSDNMNQPVSGHYYRMYTPLRGNRYATGNGADAAITGPTEATTKASVWQFVTRVDGAYDIINLADGTYISPASSNNTALKTVVEQPTAGWTINKATATGNVIVVSGSVQFNQQKDGNLYLLNWGSGTNTTDEGCQYRFIDVSTSIPPQPIVKLVDLTKETYPYTVDDALAAKAFAQENITIAVDVVTPASMSGRQALVCGADPTKAATGATKTNSPYIAYGFYGSNPVYLASSSGGDRFTYREFAATANTKYQIVYVIDKTNKQFSIYVNGELKSTATYPVSDYELQSFSNFAANANAKLYIGGGAVSSNASYDKFGGQVRSVQFFDGALSAEKVAMLEYPIVAEDIILDNAATANTSMNIYGLQRYLGLVQNAGTGIAGDGQLVCNYPAATSQESGNAYANLIDGNYTTFFHSGYGNTIGTGSHYLQADLGKKVDSFRFYFKKRSQNNNNRPTKITIEGSNDKETWNEVQVINSGLPTSETVLDYYSEEISSVTAYQHYRFTVNTTNNSTVFYTFSEFYILPSTSMVVETFDAVRAYRTSATVETATALNTVYAWNKGVTEGSPIVGVESYIYADTYKDGAFVNRFFYNNGGSLATATGSQNEDAYIWIPAVTEDGKYNFKNKVGKYFAHKGMSENAHNFTVAASTHHAGVTLHTQGSNYFVIKNADGGFDQSSITYDQKTTNYCTDFVFIPVDLYKESKLYVKVEVDGLDADNPNTHLGNIRVNGAGKKLLTTTGVTQYTFNDALTTTVDFARGYRGFELQGFFLNDQNLGKSVTLTEEQKALITEENPLIAKFTTTDEATLFYDDDEYSYRIPAIATTSTGRIIAVSDYRHNLDDIGRDNHGTGTLRIDLVARYSDDNGATWSEKQTIAEGSGNKNADGYDCAYGDAAIATVGQNVLVMAAAGNVCYPYASASSHNRTVRLFSADNGVTWIKEDISEKLFIGEDALIPNGHAAFFGSGKLAVDEDYNGTGKPRVYGAMLLKNASTTTNIYVIYTDDLGLTWSILGGSTEPIANNDEPKVEILPSGQVLLSVRRGGGRQFNVFTYTDKSTNAGTWDNNVNGCTNGGNNTCNGEIFCVDAKNEEGATVKLLLQSQPKGGSGLYDRRNVTIWYKEITDATYTSEQIASDWTEGLQVSTQLSAYSTMTLQKDGKIAFFFEEAPCYDDNYTKGYCMVYIPLTIEDITKDTYNTVERININSYEIATFYANEAVEIPMGVVAYVATTVPEMNGTEGTIAMSKIEDGIIPARTGVLLRGAEGTYTFAQAAEAGTFVSGNLLVGYAGSGEYQEVALPTDGSTNYVLAVMNGVAGFYKKDTAFKVYNNKAYLNVPGTTSATALRIHFADEETTGIDNSELTIQNTTVIYDLMGRKVTNPTKGVYIVNGKKVVK